MNSRCAGHPKHTLAPGYSSRRTCSSMARELQPSGTASGQVQLSPLGTWAPNPALSTHLSLSHWEQWEYLQRSTICFFLEAKMVETDQLTDQALLPTSRYLLLIPQPGTLSLASLAMLWATCSSQDFLVTQCFGMSCQGQELFLPFLFQVTKAQTNPIWLALWAQDGSFTYKGLSTDSHRSFSAACLCLSPFCLKEEKQ